jgi:hypothetical protein
LIVLKPKICNLCGGKVIFTSNSAVYGKEYGSGKCYLCTKCGSYVGTHKDRPDVAFGILANKEMREMKMKCHELFDEQWKRSKKRRRARQKAYMELSLKLNIPVDECHFGYFDLDMLNKAYRILESEV